MGIIKAVKNLSKLYVDKWLYHWEALKAEEEDEKDLGFEFLDPAREMNSAVIEASRLPSGWAWVYQWQHKDTITANAGMCRYAQTGEMAYFEALFNLLNNLPFLSKDIVLNVAHHRLRNYLMGHEGFRDYFLTYAGQDRVEALEDLINHIIDSGYQIHFGNEKMSNVGKDKIKELDTRIRFYDEQRRATERAASIDPGGTGETQA